MSLNVQANDVLLKLSQNTILFNLPHRRDTRKTVALLVTVDGVYLPAN